MSSSGSILVTGGAGYVGTHTVVELLEAGYDVVVMDNLVNSKIESLGPVRDITGKEVPAYVVDLLDKDGMREIFKKHNISCVMHFASLKAVGESCKKPLVYYRNNFGGTMCLLEVMQEFNVYNMIFSSSATTYGPPRYFPIDEKHPVGGCTNPYGKTKFFIEEMLRDLCTADKKWKIILLRYFNPVGAHASGKIGEDPNGIPHNLMPNISQVAVGKKKEFTVYGNDYDTHDHTGVRDYIHVVDLAQGHIAAITKLDRLNGCKAYNLGRGTGYSVLEMAKAFEKASGKPIAYKFGDRRDGDVPTMVCGASLAAAELGWKAKLDLTKMCEDLWRWQSMNPTGFRKEGSS